MSTYTDSKKLTNRINAHKNFAKYDVNKWALEKISLKNGEKFLEIGCGTGEQLIKCAKSCPDSKIIGIDLTDDSLGIIKQTCLKEGLENVITIKGNMDDLPILLNSENDFDVVISCFALYYSKDIPQMISKIKKILKPNGRLFVCGPVEGNNKELIQFQKDISESSIKKIRYVMSEDILPEILKNFSQVHDDYFVNPVEFPNVESVMSYWKSYYLYEPTIEKEFSNLLKEYFSKNSIFLTTKKILGVLGKA